jgi:hypothetical protein
MSENSSPVRKSPGKTRQTQPSPDPSVRLSANTPPIRSRQPSLKSSAAESFVLKSPHDFRYVPTEYDRRISDMVKELVNDAYLKGRKDGSQYGSQVGLQEEFQTTSILSLVCRTGGIQDPSFEWDDADVNLAPRRRRRDSVDSRHGDFLGKNFPEHVQNRGDSVLIDIPEEDAAHPELAASTTTEQQNVQMWGLADRLQKLSTMTPEERIRTFEMTDNERESSGHTPQFAAHPSRKVAKKTYDAQKSAITKMIRKFQDESMNLDFDTNGFEQHLFFLTNNMNTNYAKYSSLITDTDEFNTARNDYQIRYAEAKSVLDAIASSRRIVEQTKEVTGPLPASSTPALDVSFVSAPNLTFTAPTIPPLPIASVGTTTCLPLPSTTAAPTLPIASVAASVSLPVTSTATVTSLPAVSSAALPPITVSSAAHLPPPIQPPLIDGATAAPVTTMTSDGHSKVQTKIPVSRPATTIAASTYPNVLPLTTVSMPDIRFSLPTFVQSSTGARPKDSFHYFFEPTTTAPMTKITGATVVISSTRTRPSVVPTVTNPELKANLSRDQPSVEDIGSDRADDFRDNPKARRQGRK